MTMQTAARITGLPAENIKVHTTFLGGGFGRRSEPDFSDYAIRLAKEAEDGLALALKPVQKRAGRS